MTTDYNDRIEQAAADSADVIDSLTALLRSLGALADKAGVERHGYLAPADLVAAISDRVDILNAKAAAHNATLAEGLRTIGYNDTEIEQCLADVPDLTMADIDYARTFAEGWTVGKKTYGSSDINDLKLRIMPKVDYSEANNVGSLFQKATNLEYIPTLDWPKVTTASYVFHDLRKLRRCPQINAPEAVNINSLCAGYKTTPLPPIINHPKATNVANLFNTISAESLATMPPLGLNWDIVSNAAQLFRGTDVDTFPITAFKAPGVNLLHIYWLCKNIKGDQSGVKWDVPNVSNLQGVFFSVPATAIDVSGIKTAECTDFQMAFDSAGMEHLDVSMWDMSGTNDAIAVFHGMPNLRTLNFSHKHFKAGCQVAHLFANCPKLRELILTDVDFTGTISSHELPFYNNPSLETIIGPVTGIAWDVNLGAASRLTAESAMVIINGLAEVNSSSAATLTLHASAYDRLTPEQIAVATSKGWRVVKNA